MRGCRSHWDVFVVFVQQPALCFDQQLLCTLVAVSKSVRDLILESCTGKVLISLQAADLKHVRRFCLWLQSHGQLVRKLDWRWKPAGDATRSELQAAEATIAAALQTASSKQQLHIQSYSCHKGTGTLQLAVLKQLPSRSITTIEIRTPYRYTGDWGYSKKFKCTWSNILSGANTGISGLTRLQELKLHTESASLVRNYVKQMRHLTALTNIEFSGDSVRANLLEHLPRSLIVLDTVLSSYDTKTGTSSNAQISISHLTALTKLSIRGIHVIGSKDKLPPKVVDLQLQCGSVSLQPLLSLRKLQRLDLSAACMVTTEQLVQLCGKASGLTQLCLDYCSRRPQMTNLDKESRNWRSLPIKQLQLREGYKVSAAVGQRLARLGRQGLTSLVLHNITFAEMPRAVAKHIQQMTQLRHLDLENLFCVPGLGAGGCVAGTRNVLQAVAGLPHLSSLRVRNMRLYGLARELSELGSRLQKLELTYCDLNDAAVADIMRKCVGLRELNLSKNYELTYQGFAPQRTWVWGNEYHVNPSPLVHLRSINIGHTKVSPEEAQKIKHHISGVTYIDILDHPSAEFLLLQRALS